MHMSLTPIRFTSHPQAEATTRALVPPPAPKRGTCRCKRCGDEPGVLSSQHLARPPHFFVNASHDIALPSPSSLSAKLFALALFDTSDETDDECTLFTESPRLSYCPSGVPSPLELHSPHSTPLRHTILHLERIELEEHHTIVRGCGDFLGAEARR
ncbi:hypothetical protein M427DRAFT_53447 [Gonapodya prolifera JEL478]|uniref:Uncharacterized protein n=1 Tax=Gonapodya prolifera (strain JEL478) TaxID=1344416 RepID=A0A139AQH1_GONPJ|nr:hypothetical protein M427DRAFT_53447 [Gonapodya prolifera JEL478]|eukprot:KXS18986.1 hypothetical protein M427DRAFT_53447 [Gonapodya prolifera JEL478]